MEPNIEVDMIERVAAAVRRQLEEQYGPAVGTLPTLLEWMTTPQAAAYLKITPKALKHLRTRRLAPPAHKISGSLRWKLSDLRAWAEAQREAVS